MGLPQLPSTEKFNGKPVEFDSHQYTDYSEVKTGTMRLWKLKKVSDTEPQVYRNRNDLTDGGSYIVTGKEYQLSDFFKDGETEITLYAEGVNAKPEALDIKLSCTKNQTPLDEASLSVTVVEGSICANSTNDITCTIDADDEIIKDQRDGFAFWPSRDQDDSVSPAGIVDLFPVKVQISAGVSLDDWDIYVSETGDASFNAYYNASDSSNRLKYLQDSATALAQMDSGTILNPQMPLDAGNCSAERTWELLFKPRNISTGNICCYMVKKTKPENPILIGSFKYTVKDDKQFFWMGSMRGEKNIPGPYDYIADYGYPNDRYIQPFPFATKNDGYADPDPARPNYLIFLHGYSVTEDGAARWGKELYKRLYWTGFRGNFVTLDWEGDDWSDPNVRNSFYTAPSFLNFLRSMESRWGATPQNVNIMAHSLGNLVMWDTLRLNSMSSSEKLVNNVISVEAAIWEEAFWDKGPLAYDNDWPYNVTYTEDDLRHNSWAFWLKNGQYNIKDSYGKYYHSYAYEDNALSTWMRYNSFLLHPSPFIRENPSSPSGYRDVETLNTLPGLLQKGHRTPFYNYTDYNKPIGMEANAFLTNTETDATLLGWEKTEHSAFLTFNFYAIYKWYTSDNMKKALGIK